MAPTHGALHLAIGRHVLNHGTAPSIEQLSRQLTLDEAMVADALRVLADDHGVVLPPTTGEIWAMHPFSAAPTLFGVESGGKGWWGNCAWCSFGIVALLRADATIVGEGSCRDTLLTLRESLGLNDHVAFVGALESERVRHHLRSAHLAVLSSEQEGHPVSLLTAASVGIPAVAPALGGIPEMIVHGETGLITDSADPRVLGNAMARLCRDHALLGTMGATARQRALRHFSADREMHALTEVWEAARRASARGRVWPACDPIDDRRQYKAG